MRKEIEAQRQLYSKPVLVGNKIAVRVLTVRNRHFGILDGVTVPGKTMVDIDPGFAFGDGTHPTTQMCAEVLEQLVRPGMAVLDIGCGTGIQSIIALKLGAGQATARDIDPAAVEIAAKNAARNGVADRFTAGTGNLADGITGSFDLIVANILADPVLELLETLHEITHPGTVVVLSGVHAHRDDEVMAAARRRFDITEKETRDGFVCYVLTPKESTT